MMMDQVAEFKAGPANKEKRPRESNSPTPSKKQRREAFSLMELEEQGGTPAKAGKDELMKMEGDSIPPNMLDTLSDDITSLSDAYTCSDFSVDEPSDTSVSTLTDEASTSQTSSMRINNYIKQELMKEIRKFGRRYNRIFILLEEVQGPLEIKKEFVDFTIREAARFKRRDLIQHLEKFLKDIDAHHSANQDSNA